MISPEARVAYYNVAFPKRPALLFTRGMVVGTWMIGSCYRNPNPLYGAYPHGYLERIHAMFPDARRILHAFSGGLKQAHAIRAAWPDAPDPTEYMGIEPEDVIKIWSDDSRDMELVDMHGPEQGRYPTWRGDIYTFCEQSNMQGRFDLILADPPYSAADAVEYDCPPVNRGKVMRALRRVAAPRGNLVWLDQVWPMHRIIDWKTWGTVGLLRSTNHRARMISFFEAM